MLNIALFGAGRIGQIHAGNVSLNPDCQLKYIVDMNHEVAVNTAKKYGAQAVSIEEALADSDVHAVLICTITETHADLIERSAKAGKAIFCEKPVDLSIDRVDACLEVVKTQKVPLMMGFNRRYDPNFSHLKNTLDSGDIGTVEMVTISSRDPEAPPSHYIKSSGGLFRDMTIHDFDVARWLLNEEPVSLYATASSMTSEHVKEAGDVDTAIITLTCKSGKMAVITNSRRASYGYDQRVEVHASGGMLTVNNMPESTLSMATEKGITSQKPMAFFLERYAAAYRLELDAFIAGLSVGVENYPIGEDGRKALIMADAAVKSIATGQVQLLTFD
ncbi:inositol 2-dehydrogenase [Marinomonas sp. 15G1-11]|uniref:Inositol 2-dehydrogenase n=1 Tax=Marinomonas phaeophyticola TaxID=3004091 RepID=A0ABT4JXF8_9GAMM|nr:inositol 2-dehydrogenase [Marinomonas sp. 15G1-11]MCZ2722762.1 inositol 2-dehydrogenase [Marinomonas sp. 15G1-11]